MGAHLLRLPVRTTGVAIFVVLLALTAGLQPAAATDTGGLVAHWTLDAHALDEEHGHDGAVGGTGPWYDAGVLASAFVCDDADNRFVVPDDPAFTLGSADFTIALWASFDAPLSGTWGGPSSVLLSQDEGPGTTNKWLFSAASDGLSFHVNGPSPGSVAVVVPFVPTVGTLHHLALVRAGTTFTFYVDGASAGAVTNSVVVPDVAHGLELCHAEGFVHDGLLDDVRLYNRALSGDEVAALADPTPKPVPELATLVLSALGVIGLAVVVGSRRRRA